MPCAPIQPHHAKILKASRLWKQRFGPSDLQLFLIRHGRASGNHYHLFNGSKNDSPLTRLGRCQARELAEDWPAKQKPDLLFCSTMKRAKSTARPLARRFGLPLHPLSELVEQDFGDWSGLSALHMKEKSPAYFFRYTDGRLSHFVKNTPNGESWDRVLARAKGFLLSLKRGHKGKTIVVVSHGVFLIACVQVLTGIKPPKLWDLRFGNTGVAKIEI